MTDEQKMLQRMGAMLVRQAKQSGTIAEYGTGAWVHDADCDMNCVARGCGAICIVYTVDRDGDITVTEVRNNGKLRVRLGERG